MKGTRNDENVTQAGSDVPMILEPWMTAPRKPTAKKTMTPRKKKPVTRPVATPSVLIEPGQSKADRTTYKRGHTRERSRADVGYFPHAADQGSVGTNPSGTQMAGSRPSTQATKTVTSGGKVIGTSTTDYANRGYDAMLRQSDVWADIDTDPTGPIRRHVTGDHTADSGGTIVISDPKTLDPITSDPRTPPGSVPAAGSMQYGDMTPPGLPGEVGNPLEMQARAGLITPEVQMLLRQRWPSQVPYEDDLAWLDTLGGLLPGGV